MPTVTSANREEFNEKEMAKKAPRMKDPASYRSFARDAEEQSKKAKTAKEHHEAMGSHKHAAMYAKPHPIHREHEAKAKFHAEENRKMERLEMERHASEREENARKANIRANKAKGVTASSDEEKRTGKYSTY